MQKRFVWWPDDRIKRFQKPKSCLTFIVIWDVETSVEVKTGHAADTEEGFEAMEDVVQSDRLFIHAAATSCTPSILVFSVRYTAGWWRREIVNRLFGSSHAHIVQPLFPACHSHVNNICFALRGPPNVDHLKHEYNLMCLYLSQLSILSTLL